MSLQQVAGGPSPAAIAETRTNAKAASGVSGKYAVIDGSDQSGNEFPVVPFAPDAYDDTAMYKAKFASGAGAGTNWVVPFTEQDASYLKRQRDQIENADFDRWVMGKFDLEDPAQLFLFQQIAPEQFQRRMDLIDYEQNLVTRYAKMRLMGPRTMEDLKFEWLIESGRVELPKGPIWDPISWMNSQLGVNPPTTEEQWAVRGIQNDNRYMAGLFSPLKMLTETQVGWNPTSNRGDIRGNSASIKRGQLFEGSERVNSSIYYGGNPIVEPQARAYAPNIGGSSFGGYEAIVAPNQAAGTRHGYGRNPLTPLLANNQPPAVNNVLPPRNYVGYNRAKIVNN